MSENVDWGRLIRASAELPVHEFVDEIRSCVPSVADVEIWLWDHQRRSLGALQSGKVTDRLDLGALIAGADHSRPLRHLGEDLGVVTIEASGQGPGVEVVDAFTHMLAVAVRAKHETNDTIDVRRRRREMSLPAEMQWMILPPTQFTASGISIDAAVEPAYDTGGDVFDYALTENRLFAAVLDARGHGLRASATSSVAAAAMRRSRRSGADIATIAGDVGASIGALGDEFEFVSAVMVELDVSTWTGSWLSAGHLPPLVVGDAVTSLDLEPALPLGLVVNGEQSEPIVKRFALQTDEALVLYSDGIVENVSLDDGLALGEQRFQETLTKNFKSSSLEQGEASEHLARDIVEDLLAMTGTVLRDDATLLIVRRPSG